MPFSLFFFLSPNFIHHLRYHVPLFNAVNKRIIIKVIKNNVLVELTLKMTFDGVTDLFAFHRICWDNDNVSENFSNVI